MALVSAAHLAQIIHYLSLITSILYSIYKLAHLGSFEGKM